MLKKNKIGHETIDVDRLGKEEQSEILDILKSYNPKLSFPTLIIGDEVIVGYNKEKIGKAIKSLKKQGKFSIRRIFTRK